MSGYKANKEQLLNLIHGGKKLDINFNMLCDGFGSEYDLYRFLIKNNIRYRKKEITRKIKGKKIRCPNLDYIILNT